VSQGGIVQYGTWYVLVFHVRNFLVQVLWIVGCDFSGVISWQVQDTSVCLVESGANLG